MTERVEITLTVNGRDYIVRVESGTINESIYRIAILDDPTNPIRDPWSAGGKKPGTWRQMHGFTGSCTAASTAAGTSFIPSHNNPTTDPDISF